MELAWVDVAKQVPSLAVLVWVVVYFLNHMQRMAADLRDSDQAAAEKLAEVVDRNSQALHRNTETHAKVLYALERHSNGGNGRFGNHQ